jgi:hypothetical protein
MQAVADLKIAARDIPGSRMLFILSFLLQRVARGRDRCALRNFPMAAGDA